jgi:hypothetical protein
LKAHRCIRETPELLGKHGEAWPVLGAVHEPGLDGIGHDISELFEDGLLGQQAHHGAPLMVPGRALPFAKDFGSERDQAMKPPQEVREATSDVGDHQVLVGAHQRDGVDPHAKLSGTYG